jgi:hypothetical protein
MCLTNAKINSIGLSSGEYFGKQLYLNFFLVESLNQLWESFITTGVDLGIIQN